MTEQVLQGRDYRTLRPVLLRLNKGKITAVEPIATDTALPIIAPGLVDLQINGFHGIDFNHFPFSGE